jgi:hypothetical protein
MGYVQLTVRSGSELAQTLQTKTEMNRDKMFRPINRETRQNHDHPFISVIFDEFRLV